jgi:hypothetical protein
MSSILSLNPNAKVSVSGKDIDTCIITWHEGTSEISKADIKNKMTTIEAELNQKETVDTKKKESGKQKLKELGLNDDEIQALIGV